MLLITITIKNYSEYFQVIGYSSNLTIFITNTTVGPYTCQVTVGGYDSIEYSATVYQQGPPVILEYEYEYIGDTIEIVCEAVSIPAPGIEWKYNNHIITSDIEHYTVITLNLDKNKVFSTLIIKDSVQSDFGDYNCSASNSYGQDTAVIHLHRKDFSLVLLLVVGLVMASLLVIITLLLFLYWRRLRQKTCVDHSKNKTEANYNSLGREEKPKSNGWHDGDENTKEGECNFSKVNDIESSAESST